MPVTVFGILHIIFGSLGLLCSPVNFFSVFFAQRVMQFSAPFKIWLIITAIVGVFTSAGLLTLGIGLLKMKKWALAGSYIYAWFAIVWGILSTTLTAVSLATGMVTMAREAMPGFIGGLAGGMIGLVYPILMLVFLRRPQVRKAFEP